MTKSQTVYSVLHEHRHGFTLYHFTTLKACEAKRNELMCESLIEHFPDSPDSEFDLDNATEDLSNVGEWFTIHEELLA